MFWQPWDSIHTKIGMQEVDNLSGAASSLIRLAEAISKVIYDSLLARRASYQDT